MPAIRHDILQNILNVAQQSIKTISPFRRNAPLYFPYPGSSTAPLLTLRLPDYVEFELLDSTVPVEFRNTLSGTITRLQKEYTNALDDAFRQSLSEPGYLTTAIYKLHASLEDMFVTQAVPQVMDRYLTFKKARMAHITQQLEADRLAEERERPQFNANHTPLLLMIYTHYTPYPTAAERFAIAEYTQMSERQIEVWFQNHRRIQKKAGFPPSRVRGPSGGVEALLASLPSPSYSQPTPEPERHPDEDPEKKYFSLTRPAFPGPPSSEFIPVPAPPPDPKGKGKGKEVPPSFLRPVPYPAHSFHFDAPWPRAAPSTPTPKPPAPTMDALTDLFACMNIHSPAQDSEGDAATARYMTDLRGRSAAYVGEGAWQSWSWSWHGRAGLLSAEWGKDSWGTRRKSAKRTSWKPYSKPQQLPRRTPSSSPLRRVPSSSSSSSSSSSTRAPSWGSQTEAPHSPASSYTSYSPSPSPPPGFVLIT